MCGTLNTLKQVKDDLHNTTKNIKTHLFDSDTHLIN